MRNEYEEDETSEEDIDPMISDCEKRQSKLTDWEVNFIDSISKQRGGGRSLTVKQIASLDQIWKRVTA